MVPTLVGTAYSLHKLVNIILHVFSIFLVNMISLQGGVGIKNMDLGSNFLLTGLRLNQPANIIRHMSILGNNDVI